MSTPAIEDRQTRQTIRIPSLLTNSLRVVLETFGTDIVHLQAHGSIGTTNTSMVEELRQYGVSREQQTLHRLNFEYEQLQKSDGTPANPLTEEARASLYTEIERILDREELTVVPDLAVTSLTIRVTEPALKEVTPARSEEFDLRFEADPAEPPIREHTRRLNGDRRLYSELGFQLTNLNLRSVTETAATKHQQWSDGRYHSWRGPDDIVPKTLPRLTVRINDRILPDPYGMAKPYTVVKNEEIQVPESALDEAIDGAETDSNADEGDSSNTGGEPA